MNSRIKALIGAAGLTAILASKACYGYFDELEDENSVILNLEARGHTITIHKNTDPHLVSFELNYTTAGMFSCSEKAIPVYYDSQVISVRNKEHWTNMNFYFENPDDFLPCLASSRFYTYKP